MARRFSGSAGFAATAVMLMAALVAACGQPLGTTLPTVPAIPTLSVPTSGPSVDIRTLAEEACLATQFPNCVDGLVQLAQTAPGSLVAICDYGDGTGNVVIIEAEGEAEAECSDGGSISPVRVVGVLRLP